MNNNKRPYIAELFFCWFKWIGCAVIVGVTFNCMRITVVHEFKNSKWPNQRFDVDINHHNKGY